MSPGRHCSRSSDLPSSLTATTLARRTADAIVTSRTLPPSSAFTPLFTGSRRNWQMSGGGEFLTLFGSILEARPGAPGLGVLWYTREAFKNFVLKVDWLSFNPTTTATPATDRQLRYSTQFGAECQHPQRLEAGLGQRLRDPDRRHGVQPRFIAHASV